MGNWVKFVHYKSTLQVWMRSFIFLYSFEIGWMNSAFPLVLISQSLFIPNNASPKSWNVNTSVVACVVIPVLWSSLYMSVRWHARPSTGAVTLGLCPLPWPTVLLIPRVKFEGLIASHCFHLSSLHYWFWCTASCWLFGRLVMSGHWAFQRKSIQQNGQRRKGQSSSRFWVRSVIFHSVLISPFTF